MFSGRCCFYSYFVVVVVKFLYGIESSVDLIIDLRQIWWKPNASHEKPKVINLCFLSLVFRLPKCSGFIAIIMIECDRMKLNRRGKYLYFHDMLYDAGKDTHELTMDHPFDVGIDQQEVRCVNVNEFGHWSRLKSTILQRCFDLVSHRFYDTRINHINAQP